jgi:RNA polymerase sigma factor (sigma-70 family)
MTRSEFEQIAAQLRQKVLKTGHDFFGNREDAEDAAQDTMVQLWRYLEHIDAERNVEALAVRVAKNCCVSIYRKRGLSRPTSTLKSGEATEPSPQDQLEAQDTQRMLSEAISLLKPRERQLFDMRALMGLSVDEITQQTGIPKLSVTAMVSAARKKVFTELKRRMKQ